MTHDTTSWVGIAWAGRRLNNMKYMTIIAEKDKKNVYNSTYKK